MVPSVRITLLQSCQKAEASSKDWLAAARNSSAVGRAKDVWWLKEQTSPAPAPISTHSDTVKCRPSLRRERALATEMGLYRVPKGLTQAWKPACRSFAPIWSAKQLPMTITRSSGVTVMRLAGNVTGVCSFMKAKITNSREKFITLWVIL